MCFAYKYIVFFDLYKFPMMWSQAHLADGKTEAPGGRWPGLTPCEQQILGWTDVLSVVQGSVYGTQLSLLVRSNPR